MLFSPLAAYETPAVMLQNEALVSGLAARASDQVDTR